MPGEVGEEVVPGVGRLRAGWREADEHRLAVGIDARAASTGSAGAWRCIRKLLASTNR
jgi:hypothetical protein